MKGCILSMNILSLLNGEISQQELLNYYNANITYENLPYGIRGFVFHHKNIYNIFINNKLSYYLKRKTILHELAHIELNQFCQAEKDLFALKIDKYEDEADKYVKFLLENKRLQ